MVTELEGLRVLLVEDGMLVCMDIEDMLADLGCAVVGPASRVDQALELIRHQPVDMAVLDVNLGTECSYPIADRLTALGVPFLLSTGYADVAAEYRTHSRLQKPFSQQQFATALEALRHSGR
ncbi:response regulator [Citreimonas salinaria]|uniref:Response regulator receiver domain-containing protein n=1 Tax=Citreimonas salinaria TaxID=321339 RepID=A0A1H3GU08_9RHOB|nr:response regulator [Citreimonas salinaria]SDY06812.1 Response regulator receiver domain-containing protein [Citreimonas salinaria]